MLCSQVPASCMQPGSPAHSAHLLCLLGVNQTSSVVIGSANQRTKVLFARMVFTSVLTGQVVCEGIIHNLHNLHVSRAGAVIRRAAG